MTTSDTAAALASALPRGHWDRDQTAAFQADRLAEMSYVLVRLDDEATVERVARGLCPERVPCSDHRNEARAALAALAARPGTADTEQAEVDRG